MPENVLDQVLCDAATEVLETMFFASPVEVPEPAGSEYTTGISATLRFRGEPSGTFGIGVPLATARWMAASFLGNDEEDVSDPQIADVICEAANVFCGQFSAG